MNIKKELLKIKDYKTYAYTDAAFLFVYFFFILYIHSNYALYHKYIF